MGFKMLHNTYISISLPHPLLVAFSSKMFCWIQQPANRRRWKSSQIQQRAEFPTSCWFVEPLDYISKRHLQSWPSVQYCAGDTLRYGCCTYTGVACRQIYLFKSRAIVVCCYYLQCSHGDCIGARQEKIRLLDRQILSGLRAKFC